MFDYSLDVFENSVTKPNKDANVYADLTFNKADLTLRRAPLLFYKLKFMPKHLDFVFENETFIKTWKQFFSLLVSQLEERVKLLSDFYKDKYIYKQTVASMKIELFYDKFFDLFYFKEDPELMAREQDGEMFNTFSDLPDYVKKFYLKLRLDVINFITGISFDYDLIDYDYRNFAYFYEDSDIMIINRLFTDLLSNVFVLKDQPATNY